MFRPLRVVLTAAGMLGSAISPAVAQDVSIEWLRTAGLLCAGTLSMEASVEGEINVVKLFGLVEPGAEGSASLELSDLNRLLDEFEGSAKDETLRSYYRCLDGFLVAATSDRPIEAGALTLKEGLVPQGLDTIPEGSRFVLNLNQTVALGNFDYLLTLYGFSNVDDPIRRMKARYTLTNTLNGRNSDQNFSLGESNRVGDRCVLTLYAANPESRAASILFRCNDN